jgi:hypothetical protein
MFPQQPQQQFRTTNADVQLFYQNATWNKPPGVSHIYMLLIGGGANGVSDILTASGAVTVWFGAAQHVPDSLVLSVSTGNASNTVVQYRGANGLNALLTAEASTAGGSAADGMDPNPFTASGFFRSVDGSISTSPATTFLSGGNASSNATGNYGYTRAGSFLGFFQLQPVIVGMGGGLSNRGGIGCGGGSSSSSGARGGPGLVIIASW